MAGWLLFRDTAQPALWIVQTAEAGAESGDLHKSDCRLLNLCKGHFTAAVDCREKAIGGAFKDYKG
jgi:hypothetical protein